ncbi:MAG: hypothetical protein LBH25_03670 [Fibromonadaceae bacterium]|jgi:hypothetical protein|nr:hypothetical protein [Fibromonadaceae bacterium]
MKYCTRNLYISNVKYRNKKINKKLHFFMRVFICFVLLIISISYANTQETAIEQNNTRVSVYLHPIHTFYFGNMYDTPPIYSTIEIPFSLSNSLIIRPSFLSNDDGTALRLGSDIGFRHYLFENGEGLYLQRQMGIFYIRRNDSYALSSNNPLDILPNKSLWLDLMCYAGYSLKYSHVSMFIDVGFGVVLGINTKTGSAKLFYDLLPDFNIGIGVPFGTAKPVNTEEQIPKYDNTKVLVYLHPASTVFGILGISPIYLTVEIPFSLSNSLIIRPSFLNISHVDGDKAFRLGSDIGFRHYLARNGEGLYLQGQMGVLYYRHHYTDCDDACPIFMRSFYNVYIPRKSLWLDAMGYIGYSLKDSNVRKIFIDIGFGTVLGISTETGRAKLHDKFWPDINIGIGIPF